MFTKHVLLGASALVVLTSLTTHAQADEIYGGGASLPAPYVRQAGNCYGTPTDLLIKANPFATSQSYAPFVYGSHDCGANPGTADTVNYISTGSGTGLAGFFSNAPTKFGLVTASTYYPSVDFAESETALGTAQVNIYNNGGTYQGVSVQGPSNPSGTSPNGLDTYGAMIQVPALVAPVVIAYDPVYKKVGATEYTLNIQTSDGKLHLDKAAYCRLFNGDITDWSDSALTSLNGGSFRDADDTSGDPMPIQIVGRSDSSGTTSLWTRHLAAVCGSGVTYNTTSNHYTASTSTLTVLSGDSAVTNDIYADQSSGVATELDFDARTQAFSGSRIGYVGPDYVAPWAGNTGSNTYNLQAATLKNANADWVAPSPATATTAFSAFTAPSGADLADPAKWVASTATSEALANPATAGAYPIIGTSNILAYTCYAEDGKAQSIKDFLSWYYTDGVVNSDGVLAAAGLADVGANFRALIVQTFVDGDENDLYIRPVSEGGKCAGKTGAAVIN